MRMPGVLIAGAASLAFCLAAGEFRIEPENFPGPGHWKNFTWKVCIGNRGLQGNVSEEVSAQFAIPDGKYTVWVRTYSYGQEYRKAEISVNGRILGACGDSLLPERNGKPTWIWTRLDKIVDIAGGKAEISCKALNRYVRIDSILFSTNPKFVPPGEKKAVEAIPELEPRKICPNPSPAS